MVRGTLREAHSHANEISRRLYTFYQVERREQHWENLHALVYVLNELCQDAILCDTFMNDGELYRMSMYCIL